MNKLKRLLSIVKNSISLFDVISVVAVSAASAGIALLFPYFMKLLTGEVIEDKSIPLLSWVAVFMITTELASALIKALNSVLSGSVSLKIKSSLDAYAMEKLLSLPLDFFRKYPAGELYRRYKSIGTLGDMISVSIIMAFVGVLSGLAYAGQIVNFAPALFLPSLIIIITTAMISGISSLMRSRINLKTAKLSAKESAVTHDMIKGMRKLRLSGSEEAAYNRWEKSYDDMASLLYEPPVFLKISPALITAVKLFGGVLLYYTAARAATQVSDYMAFNTAYGGLLAAISGLFDLVLSYADFNAAYDLASVILDAETIDESDRAEVDSLHGDIDVSHVSFSYGGSGKVLDDVSFSVKSGEYVAIAGETGCGKSTLIRLLLGLAVPDSGSITYDGRDISTLKTKTVRAHIGAVIQDGRMFSEDIFTNIKIASSDLTMDEAWQAAEAACVDEDIKALPLAMYSDVAEGDGWLSGGQRQRILIARALAKHPDILIMDEATSALDNELQKRISDRIDAMGITRIVVAHRISAIKNADRILFIDGGRITESGTYDELMERRGGFYKMAKRQIPD